MVLDYNNGPAIPQNYPQPIGAMAADLATINAFLLAPATPNRQTMFMQMNGRKVLGPPDDWVGPPPSSSCELFVRRIPKQINDQKLIQPFLRFGCIYEIRLPLDFNQGNRGYAYIKYTCEEDAACAMEVLTHYYIAPRRTLEIMHSYEKCRLFVSNIPRHLNEREIEEDLRQVFPNMLRVYTRGVGPPSETHRNGNSDSSGGVSSTAEDGNRGHVFVHFSNHFHALEAKKQTTPGVIRMWGRDLKVVWANTERQVDIPKGAKTLFVRNVDLSVNNRDIIDMLVKYVPRTTIRKISKVRTTAFFDFTSREAAEVCMQQLQGQVLCGQRLDIEWAKPSDSHSLHRLRSTDFDAVLRLKCIANGWHIPVIIFGTYFETECLQYCVVMLRNCYGIARAVFCIIQTHDLIDVHSRLCEVVCVLIDTIGVFPDYNYMFFVQKDFAHLLGMVSHSMYSVDFIASHNVPHEFFFDLNEVIDLSWAIATISSTPEMMLIHAYQESFRTNRFCTYLQNFLVFGHRIFGSIMPKYRNKPPLKYNLNDSQIVLALCFASTGTNSTLPTRPYIAFPVSLFDTGYEGLRYLSLRLWPNALSQSRYNSSHVLKHIVYRGTSYYHPAQRLMAPPFLVTVCSYSLSIKQPEAGYQYEERQLVPYTQTCASAGGQSGRATTSGLLPVPPNDTVALYNSCINN